MYTKRIQLINYGPIEKLDIGFPFEGETPKPVLLVGENGSGKSILLSHIVNGLIAAKDAAFPETPEVDPGKVYKLRSSSYIKSGSEYYFSRVDFDGSFFTSEIRTRLNKQEYPDVPEGISGTVAQVMWEKVGSEENDHYDSNLSSNPSTTKRIKGVFAKNCVLYFPFNRFEEPAWLNEENLKAQAQYMDMKHISGYTNRKVIASSPLHENQDWLFDVAYDRAAFEIQTPQINLPANDGSTTFPLPVFLGYSGYATRSYDTALQIVRTVMRRGDIRFGIGRRHNRVVSIMSELGSHASRLVPNVFQLSSGETSLWNLFLSILRDFDLCGTPFSSTDEIRGIVVVDEIDLHLHAVHQHEVLPELIKMFPNVQFVVTAHSPLFVLGMQRVLGEDGFALYRLPHGRQIDPEEFSEFGDAYRAFTDTVRFTNDIRTAMESAQKPIVFVEGETDQRYIQNAAQMLGKVELLESVELRDGMGAPNLKKIWETAKHIDFVTQRTVLLFDCDNSAVIDDNKGNLARRRIPKQEDSRISKGIENLFGESTLQKARDFKEKFFDIIGEHELTKRGEPATVPEQWIVDKDEKGNLCDWLCEHGTPEDFARFHVIFDILREVLDMTALNIANADAESSQ